MIEWETIVIPAIGLEWSEWVEWTQLQLDARSSGGVRIPNGQPGVYEAHHKDSEERLTIGKAGNLRFRIRQGLIHGKAPHSSGQAIRMNENVSTIVLRWAVTTRPSAVEEELHRRYKEKFGRLPKYTQHT